MDKDFINELSDIIESLNKEEFQIKSEDDKRLLNVLLSVNKNKTRAVLSSAKKAKKPEKKVTFQKTFNITEDEIEKLFQEESPEDIARKYTKSQLEDMYSVIHNGIKPLSNSNKISIIDSINSYFHTLKRNHDLYNL